MICSSLIFAQPEAGFIVERRECVRCLLQGLPVCLRWRQYTRVRVYVLQPLLLVLLVATEHDITTYKELK